MKTVIIVGGCKGIGKSISLKFKKNNYNVLATYLNSYDDALKLKDLKIDVKKVDCTSEKDMQELFSYALLKYKKIDVLVNCAGISLKQKFVCDISGEEFDNIINVNLKGTFNSIKQGVLNMLSTGGCIINISSIYGIVGGSCESVYSASKFGVIGLTKSVAEELSNSNLSICAVAPGLINTQMNNHLTEEEKLEFVSNYGLKKIGKPIDVANKVYNISNMPFNKVNGKIFKVSVGKI